MSRIRIVARTAASLATPAMPAYAAALLLVAGGCGGDAGGARASAAVVRDSSGVQIVESSAPAWPEGNGPTMAAEPMLVIGEMDGPMETQLYQVRAAFRMDDGRIAIFDGGSNELRYFGSDGQFQRKVGGKGGGPGEYQFINWVARMVGDSIMVDDFMAQRLTVLGPDGAVARTINLAAANAEPAPPSGEGGAGRGGRVMMLGMGRYEVLAPFADGSLLARARGMGASMDGTIERDSVLYLRLGPDGTLTDTIGVFPGDETQASTAGGGESRVVMFGAPPFGRTAQVQVDGDGFYFGSTDRYEIGRYSADGRLTRLIRRPVEPLPVREEDAAALKEKELNAERVSTNPQVTAQLRLAVEKKWEDVQLPKTMPAHGPLEVDRAGRLWVRATTRPAETTPRYDVFDRGGRYLGQVALPEKFRILEIGEDYVLGVARDESDVEQVRLHALTMAPRGS